jgi:uncharacterized repeat protein (TIGR03806 family)
MEIERVFTSLSFTSPVHLTHAPDGTNRIFVVEQPGRIRVFPNRADAATATDFLDIRSKVGCCGEEGLLSVAFHPRYESNRYFYVYHTAHSPRRSVIARYQTMASDPNRADPDSELVILEVPQPFSNHNGGQMAFGPDGYLYIALGDGGSGGDPQNNSQNLGNLLGKILRIDVDRTEGQLRYAIPADNPFRNTVGARGEIWAYGLRNPWRFSFDRIAGTLWTADVGQNAWEEVDVVVRGGNYGWRRMEGFECFNPATGCNDGSLILPVTAYSHSFGCSVTGGFVYRGTRLPELQGAYLYGDYCSGIIWALRWDGTRVTEERILVDSSINISSFGEDQDGEVYVVHHGGTLHRLRRPAAGSPGTFPTTLTATGCYADVPSRTPVASLIPYDVNAPLWSDGTLKRRFLVLPGTTTIGYRARGAWDLPDGTLIVKEFLLETVRGDPASRRPLETRFLVRRGTEWQGFTYQWNDSGTEGFLLTGSATKTFTVTDPRNPPSSYTHYFPSREDCQRCHTAAAGGVLGLQTGQMNRNHDYGGIVDNQLRAMEHIGLFGGALPSLPDQLPRFPAPSDPAAPLEARARSYLHGNCAQCHLPGGPSPTSIDLRFETPLAQTGTCGAAPQNGNLGVAGAEILKPGAPNESVLWLRLATRGANQMPPLATSLVDDAASALVRDWIASLTGCPP